MKTLLISGIAIAATTVLPAHTAAAAELPAVCAVRVEHAPVRVPRRAVELKQSGIALVRAEVDATGRARNVATVSSSGHSRLDAAAERAVGKRWTFDVSQCNPTLLPAVKIVAVEFASATPTLVSTDKCYFSSRTTEYGRLRTKACLAAPVNAAALAGVNP